MNSCMKCLLSIPEFNNYFVNKIYIGEKTSNKKSLGCEALREFIDSYRNSSGSIRPTTGLYEVCHSFLRPREQHDCQVNEYLNIMIL